MTDSLKALRVDSLRTLLTGKTCNLPFVRAFLFDSTYTPEFVDWILYIDSAGSVTNEALTQNNEVLRPNPILRGEQFVHVIAFIEGPLPDVNEPDPKKALLQALSLLSDTVVKKDEVRHLRKAFFLKDGRRRESAMVHLLDFLTELRRIQDTRLVRPFPFPPAPSRIDSLRVLDSLMRAMTDSLDTAAVETARRTLVDPTVRLDLRRLVMGIAQGELPPAEMVPGSRADSVVQSVLNYLTDPANHERLTAVRKLIARGADEQHPDSIRISREVLQFQPDPFLVRVVTGFGSKLFGAAPSLGTDKALADSGFLVPLEDLGHGSRAADSTTHLYLAFAKLPIADNIWGRLSVTAPPGKRLRGARSVLTNFITTSGSRFGVSLAGGLVPDATTQTFSTDASGRANVEIDTIKPSGQIDTVLAARPSGTRGALNIYLIAHFRPLRRRPWPLHYAFLPIESVSGFVGTNLVRGSLLDEIVYGVSVDRPFGIAADVLLGWVRLPTKAADRSTHLVTQAWVTRRFFGVGFEL